MNSKRTQDFLFPADVGPTWLLAHASPLPPQDRPPFAHNGSLTNKALKQKLANLFPAARTKALRFIVEHDSELLPVSLEMSDPTANIWPSDPAHPAHHLYKELQNIISNQAHLDG